MKGTFKTTLGKTLENLIGHQIGEEHIHSDKQGWFYYIPAKSLHPNHPLIMAHYRGPFFVVLPCEDYELLDDGRMSINTYIDNASWSFGYFWGGGSLLNGVYWQPLEEGPGIHNTEKIRHYLTILKCRTQFQSSGYMPSAESCASCPLTSCPFSKYKSEGSSWESEVQEHDVRKDLFNSLRTRISNNFGLNCISCTSNSSSDSVILSPLAGINTVQASIPQEILIDMLYHPDMYNIKATANSLKFEICVPGKTERIAIPNNAGPQFFCDFWQNRKEPQMVEKKTEEAKKFTLWGKFKNFLGI